MHLKSPSSFSIDQVFDFFRDLELILEYTYTLAVNSLLLEVCFAFLEIQDVCHARDVKEQLKTSVMSFF